MFHGLLIVLHLILNDQIQRRALFFIDGLAAFEWYICVSKCLKEKHDREI